MKNIGINFNTRLILGSFFFILLFPFFSFSSENTSDEDKYVLKKYSSESNYGGNISKMVMESFYDENWRNIKTITVSSQATGPAQKTTTFKFYEDTLLTKEKSTITFNGEIQMTSTSDHYYNEGGKKIKTVTVGNHSGNITTTTYSYGNSSENMPIEIISESEYGGNKFKNIMRNTLDECGQTIETAHISNGKANPNKRETKNIYGEDCKIMSSATLMNGELLAKGEYSYLDGKFKEIVSTNYLPTGELKTLSSWEYDDLGRNNKMITKSAQGSNIVTYEWIEKK